MVITQLQTTTSLTMVIKKKFHVINQFFTNHTTKSEIKKQKTRNTIKHFNGIYISESVMKCPYLSIMLVTIDYINRPDMVIASKKPVTRIVKPHHLYNQRYVAN
jgi:hypothetical protein